MSPLPPRFVAPFVPTGVLQPPSGALWLHEIKHNGSGSDLTNRSTPPQGVQSAGPRQILVTKSNFKCGDKIGSRGRFRMEIYEIELCQHGRWEQQHARFVAARDADEAAYKVTGEHLRSERERRKLQLRVKRVGNGSPPPKLFYAA